MSNCSVCNIPITRKIDGGHRVDHAGNVIRYCTNCKGLKGSKGGKKTRKDKHNIPRTYTHSSFGMLGNIHPGAVLTYQAIVDMFKTLGKINNSRIDYLATKMFPGSLIDVLSYDEIVAIDTETVEPKPDVVQLESVFLKALALANGGSVKIDRAVFEKLLAKNYNLKVDTEHDKDSIEIKIEETTEEELQDETALEGEEN